MSVWKICVEQENQTTLGLYMNKANTERKEIITTTLDDVYPYLRHQTKHIIN